MQTSYQPCKFFQPHGINPVGNPLIPPTNVTQVPHYLFDYQTVSEILYQMYNNLATDYKQFNQTIYVSGHMEYTLKNQTSEPIWVECYRWTVIKAVPQELVGIPGTTVSPVVTGNILNLIGKAYVYEASAGGNADGSNGNLQYAENNILSLSLLQEFVRLKKFRFQMHPGRTRKFKVGVKRLQIDVMENYNFQPPIAITNPAVWANSFIPGATGLLFRVEGIQGIPNSPSSRTDNTAISWGSPEISYSTVYSYTVYDWQSYPEQSYDIGFAAVGVTAGVANNAMTVVNEETGNPQVINTA